MTVLEVISEGVCWKKVIFRDHRWLPRICYADDGCPSRHVVNKSLESPYSESEEDG